MTSAAPGQHSVLFSKSHPYANELDWPLKTKSWSQQAARSQQARLWRSAIWVCNGRSSSLLLPSCLPTQLLLDQGLSSCAFLTGGSADGKLPAFPAMFPCRMPCPCLHLNTSTFIDIAHLWKNNPECYCRQGSGSRWLFQLSGAVELISGAVPSSLACWELQLKTLVGGCNNE